MREWIVRHDFGMSNEPQQRQHRHTTKGDFKRTLLVPIVTRGQMMGVSMIRERQPNIHIWQIELMVMHVHFDSSSSSSSILKSSAFVRAGIESPVERRNTGKGTSSRRSESHAPLLPRNPASMYWATRSLNLMPRCTARVFASRNRASGRSMVVLTREVLHIYAFLSKWVFDILISNHGP